MAPAHALLAIPLVLAQIGENPNEVVSRAGRVGISLERRAGVLVVTQVEPGSSAETVGLKVGDQLLRIDLDNTERLSPTEAGAQLRGALGTRTTLTILPRAAMVPKRIDVMRDVRVYLANENNRISDPTASATPEPDPSTVRTLDAAFLEATSEGQPVSGDIASALARSGTDVATCIGALRDVLPEGFPAEFSATMTIRRDSTTVRTEPPSGDLASCLGKRSATWGFEKPGKNDPPLVLRATWRWTESS